MILGYGHLLGISSKMPYLPSFPATRKVHTGGGQRADSEDICIPNYYANYYAKFVPEYDVKGPGLDKGRLSSC